MLKKKCAWCGKKFDKKDLRSVGNAVGLKWLVEIYDNIKRHGQAYYQDRYVKGIINFCEPCIKKAYNELIEPLNAARKILEEADKKEKKVEEKEQFYKVMGLQPIHQRIKNLQSEVEEWKELYENEKIKNYEKEGTIVHLQDENDYFRSKEDHNQPEKEDSPIKWFGSSDYKKKEMIIIDENPNLHDPGELDKALKNFAEKSAELNKIQNTCPECGGKGMSPVATTIFECDHCNNRFRVK